MKEELVNYDILSLAKEKGFKPEIEIDYSDGVSWEQPVSQSMLQKWLRVDYGIDVWVSKHIFSSSGGWGYNIRSYRKGILTINLENQGGVSLSFEEALELGLIEGLKYI